MIFFQDFPNKLCQISCFVCNYLLPLVVKFNSLLSKAIQELFLCFSNSIELIKKILKLLRLELKAVRKKKTEFLH